MTDVDALVHRTRPAQGAPQGALVLLHGRGADEHDLFPLLDALDPNRRLTGVTARAPLSLPPGGAHWYVLGEVGFPDRPTFDSTLALLGGWIDALLASLGVTHERMVLGGFSQGTAMSYAAGLGAGRPRPAGIIALSGFIPTVDGFDVDLSNLDGYPVAIGHGTMDPIIGVAFGRAARQRLEAAGADVLYRESPMAHTIDPRFVHELQPWLERVLS